VIAGGSATALRIALLMTFTPPFANQSVDGSVPSARACGTTAPRLELVFVTQKPMRHPIDKMGLAARQAFHQHKGVACRIRIILDPVLHVLSSCRTAKHDAGHCCSIGLTPAVIVTQINLEQLFIGRL
jgi:hypothetical protein